MCANAMRSSAGAISVVHWGITLYLNENLTTLTSKGPVSFFFPAFSVWTALSARPFEARCMVRCKGNMLHSILLEKLSKLLTDESWAIL